MKPPGISLRAIPRPSKAGFLASIAAFLLLLAFAELTHLDLWLQDHFFNYQTGQWIVDKDAPFPKWLFYRGPKYALIAYGVALLWASLRKAAWLERREAIYLLLCLALVPILIAVAKNSTGVCCPSEIVRYGGHELYRTLFQSIRAATDCHCFPAGHSSGGFALLSVGFLRRRYLWIGLAAGWGMGLYQMFKGAHYLSHTLATMILAWILVQAIAFAFASNFQKDAPLIKKPAE